MPPLYTEPDNKYFSTDRLKKIILHGVRKIFGREFQVKLRFLFYTKRWPDISNPQRLSDKILQRILRTNDMRYAQLSDKWQVREYVREKVGDEILIPLLGVYDVISPEDIRALNQERLVLKNNHDSGSATIVSVKNDNLENICARLNSNTRQVYREDLGEYWYKDIQPKIIAESFISDDGLNSPSDYRFHMFNQGNGEFKMVFSINYGHGASRSAALYDEDLNILPVDGIRLPNANERIKQSEYCQIEKMKDIAKLLASDFDYVRVDLYLSNGHIYFGEMTFSPHAGLIKFNPDEFDLQIGGLWKSGVH